MINFTKLDESSEIMQFLLEALDVCLRFWQYFNILMSYIKIVCLVFLAYCVHAEQALWRELVFSYEGNVVRLLRVTPFSAMQKRVQSPNEAGALTSLPYTLDWQDEEGNSLLKLPVQLPLGLRVPLPEVDSHEGAIGGILPTNGVFIVRVPSPSGALQPSRIRLASQPRPLYLKAGDDQPSQINFPSEMEFSLGDRAIANTSSVDSLAAGMQGYVKLRDTGPDTNRFVLVVMGDGYTAANITAGTYSNHVATFLATLKTKTPWDILWNGLNIYRVDLESNQQGSDYEDQGPPNGTLKDTYLNTQFWYSGIDRLLYLDSTGLTRASAAANASAGVGRWDIILVLVNSTIYGGAGGSVAVSSVNSAGPEVTAHELGHSFAGLADEYHYSDSTRYSGGNPSEPNVDISTSSPKWRAWIKAGTPLPTPDNSTYSSTVGTFEGAYYKQYGVYRPWQNCKMKALNYGFCPVCKESHLLKFFNLIALTDYVTPGTGSILTVTGQTNLVLGIIPLPGMTNRWTLNGQPLATGGPLLTLTTAQLSLATNVLSATVTYITSNIIARTIEKVISWKLASRGLTVNGTPHWWLVGYGLNTETGDLFDDGDGMQSWQEYIADTNPTNRNDCFQITVYSNNSPRSVGFKASGQRVYSLQTRTSLSTGSWSDVSAQTRKLGVGGPMVMTDTNASPSRFYRVKVEVP